MIKLMQAKWAWIAVLGIVALWWMSRDTGTTNINYQTQTLSRGGIESIVNTAGTINPTVTVQVGSEVSGLISELSADFNSSVEAGQLLARIDDRDIRVTLRQREADLEAARARLIQEKASLINAEAQLQFARNELERIQSLVERNLVSESQLEQATNAVRGAEAGLEQAKSNIVSADATILQREAQLEQAQIDLERTYIRSPVDGVVLNRLVDLGQAVSANQTIPTLFEVAQDLSAMQIEASIDEADIGKIREGLPVRFRVDAYPQQSFDGAISQVRKAAINTANVVSYKVIIAANNPNEILLPGMTANVDIILGSKTDVLRVSNAALRFRPPESALPDDGGATPTAGGQPDQRTAQLTESLGLSAQQGKEVERIFAAQSQAVQAAGGGSGGFGPGFDRNAMANIRAKTDNELNLVLTDAQYSRYRDARARTGSGRSEHTESLNPGEVWVLNDRGQPERVALRTGLADAEYTEIVSERLQEGDEVIVRATLVSP